MNCLLDKLSAIFINKERKGEQKSYHEVVSESNRITNNDGDLRDTTAADNGHHLCLAF